MSIPTDPAAKEEFLKRFPFLTPDPALPKTPAAITTAVSTIILQEEFATAIASAAPDKATGTNNQRSNELKKALPETLDIMLAIANLSIIQKKQPSSWKLGHVVLLHKKGASENAMNYRPIALLQSLYKIVTAVLNTRVVTVLEANNAITPLQAGFLHNRGTTEQVAEHIATLSNAKANKNELHVTYIDLQKAFEIRHSPSCRHYARPRTLQRSRTAARHDLLLLH